MRIANIACNREFQGLWENILAYGSARDNPVYHSLLGLAGRRQILGAFENLSVFSEPLAIMRELWMNGRRSDVRFPLR